MASRPTLSDCMTLIANGSSSGNSLLELVHLCPPLNALASGANEYRHGSPLSPTDHPGQTLTHHQSPTRPRTVTAVMSRWPEPQGLLNIPPSCLTPWVRITLCIPTSRDSSILPSSCLKLRLAIRTGLELTTSPRLEVRCDDLPQTELTTETSN